MVTRLRKAKISPAGHGHVVEMFTIFERHKMYLLYKFERSYFAYYSYILTLSGYWYANLSGEGRRFAFRP